jgi:2-C-methyl-D-erythritol 2,4-cyclodiphosphate synthase
MDAMLGAAGLRDIGYYFPNNDEKYRNIRSTILLEKVYGLISEAGYKVNNIDVIVVAEYPHMAPYIEKIKEILSGVLNINTNQIAIKATTEEGLGFIGAKEGIAVHSVVSLIEKDKK